MACFRGLVDQRIKDGYKSRTEVTSAQFSYMSSHHRWFDHLNSWSFGITHPGSMSGSPSRCKTAVAHRLRLTETESFSRAQQMKQIVATQVVLQGPKPKIGIQKNGKTRTSSGSSARPAFLHVPSLLPFAQTTTGVFSTTSWSTDVWAIRDHQGLFAHKENSFVNHSGLFHYIMIWSKEV